MQVGRAPGVPPRPRRVDTAVESLHHLVAVQLRRRQGQCALRTVDDLRQLNQLLFLCPRTGFSAGAGVCDEIAIGCARQRLEWFAGRGRQFVVTESACNSANLSQRSIYDERYSAGSVRPPFVLFSPPNVDALEEAMSRAVATFPFARRISLFDFGYGTGRVIMTGSTARRVSACGQHQELRLVAYDVSSVGLRIAQERLHAAGYEPTRPVSGSRDPPRATSLALCEAGTDASAQSAFVHGCEDEPPDVMRELALTANDGTTTCSPRLYGGLGHVPGGPQTEYFRQLSEPTSPRGEIILCLSATGDLVEVQPEWGRRLAAGSTGGFPIERHGDLVYAQNSASRTSTISGTELNDYMKSITTAGQRWWIEGIRYPGEEFESLEAEQANYRLVRQANERKRDRIWNAEDYREFHSIAAFRSPVGPVNCG